MPCSSVAGPVKGIQLWNMNPKDIWVLKVMPFYNYNILIDSNVPTKEA
jgi:hypothetical protein